MMPYAPRFTILFWMAVSACATSVYTEETAQQNGDWLTVCQQAKESFKPLTEDDLVQPRQHLREAIDRLAQRLDRDTDDGKQWKAYLRWDAILAALNSEPADLEQLDGAFVRLSRQHEGLDLVWFVDVREALRHYLDVARAIDDPGIRAAHGQLLDALPARLEAFADNPTPAEAEAIGGAIGWLEDHEQADALVRLVRERFRRPNFFAQLSLAVVSAGMAQPVDRTEPVYDYILGTRVHGTGHTQGTLSVEFFPDDEDAVVDTVLLGKTESDTIGYNGPVRVYTTGVTKMGARKRFIINADGIRALAAVSDANTSTTFDGLCAVRGGKLVEQIAWKRAYRDKCRAEAIAAFHAEGRVNAQIDRQAEEMLAKANKTFVEKFRRPLVERKLLPDPFRFSTTEDTLLVSGLEASARQLGAVGEPPAMEPADVMLRLHESAINNAAATLLAGRYITEAEFISTVSDILGHVPEQLAAEEGQEPWAVHFADREPFSITLGDGTFRLAVHAVGYTRGNSDYPGMNVAANYRIEATDAGFQAVRQGDLEVFPPGFVVGQRRLSAREQTLRSLLESRFDKIFAKQWSPDATLELPGEWKKAGKLRMSQWTANRGWMGLAWSLPAEH